MKVILLEELKGRGGEGDVVEVATGYAVNYLLPRKLAVLATKGNLKQLELRKHNIAKRESTRLDTADKMFAAIDGQKIRIGAKVGDEGQLFGSVTAQRVADALNAKFNTTFDKKRIDLGAVIKKTGEYQASVTIYRDAQARIIIEVMDEKKLAEIVKNEAAAAKAATVAEEPTETDDEAAVVTEEATGTVDVAGTASDSAGAEKDAE